MEAVHDLHSLRLELGAGVLQPHTKAGGLSLGLLTSRFGQRAATAVLTLLPSRRCAWASARCCSTSPRRWPPRTSRAPWRCSARRCGS